MEPNKRLGRGLSALLGDIGPVQGASSDRPKTVPIEHLSPNPQNPRRAFHEEPLDELTESIRHHGVMAPLLVRPVGDRFEIIAGERRWRAAQRAGLHDVPVVVRPCSAAEALELALIENVQRTDLNAIEEAAGYQRLVDEFGHTQEALAKIIGKSRSHVANILRLLALPPSIRASVADGSLSFGHARALVGAPDAEAIAEEVMRRGLSVRATEALVRAMAEARAPETKSRAAAGDPDTRALVHRLSSRLGLAVSLNHKADETGALTIRYSSLEQLDAVCRLLGDEG